MKPTAALASLMVVLFAAAPSSYASTQKRRLRNCAPRNARVLLSDRYAQAYEYRFGVYGCLRHSRSVQYLGHSESSSPKNNAQPILYCATGAERCGTVSRTAMAGTVVAYAESRLELGGRAPEQIVVRSISTGRALHAVPVRVATVRQTLVEEASILRVAVDNAGTVAWIQEDSFARHGGATPPPAVWDVFAIDRTGFHSLRTDLPALPRSLKLARGRLAWLQAGVPQSAGLN